jgi:hypothetical protein
MLSFRYGSVTADGLIATCARHGILIKQGQKRKNWKERQFVLKENFLFYFTPGKPSDLKGIVLLHKPIVEDVPQCFELF